MANIHIARNRQTLGSFSEEEVREGIRTGRFTAADLSWREGMETWKPLGEMASEWNMEMPEPDLPAIFGADAALSGNMGALGDLGEGTGPAWEERETLGFFPALAQTIRAVLFQPTHTFATMKQTGGLASPLLYFVLLSSTMFAVSAFYQLVAVSINPATFAPQLEHAPKSALHIALLGSILLSPALYVLSAFVSSGLAHLGLKIVGGANRPFETTFRVICYAQASAAVLNFLPLCGSLIGVLWGAYCIIIGLKEAHGTQGWRATVAITLPGLFCCGILLLAGVAAGVGVADLSKFGH